jgi:hypothetical protein
MYATGTVKVVLGDIDVVTDTLAQGYDVSGESKRYASQGNSAQRLFTLIRLFTRSKNRSNSVELSTLIAK